MECISVCRPWSCSKRSVALDFPRSSEVSPHTASLFVQHITTAKGGIVKHRIAHRHNLGRKESFGLSLPCWSYGRVGLSKKNGHLRVCATASPMDVDDNAPGKSAGVQTKTMTDSVLDWLDALHRFSRPHTVIGSALGIVSVSLLALQSPTELSAKFFVGLVQALIPSLFMNIYIVGLNQIYDVDIDKVNKPYLPLASGEYTMGMGVAIVTISALLSLAMGAAVGSRPLLWALLVSLVLGTAYSVDVPLLRWKRSALAAATCILAVRAIVVQMGFYFHMQSFVFGRAAMMTKPLLFATAFMSFFSVVIALAKDMPDVEGDKIYGIRSFSVRAGHKKIFWLCVWLIQAAYAVAMGVGVTNPFIWGKASMILGHAGLAAILWKRANSVDLKSKTAITSFYMFIWQLFYAEYLILPFVR
ncbi:hypothetical protein R1sor_009998 [Riccia sorocarpa]|uniref:Homogentisate phytyltransferase n=1 Tax=Riccia sorocarpa TaxID=122646 RepID=A0ABD3I0D1_9MARC